MINAQERPPHTFGTKDHDIEGFLYLGEIAAKRSELALQVIGREIDAMLDIRDAILEKLTPLLDLYTLMDRRPGVLPISVCTVVVAALLAIFAVLSFQESEMASREYVGVGYRPAVAQVTSSIVTETVTNRPQRAADFSNNDIRRFLSNQIKYKEYTLKYFGIDLGVPLPTLEELDGMTREQVWDAILELQLAIEDNERKLEVQQESGNNRELYGD